MRKCLVGPTEVGSKALKLIPNQFSVCEQRGSSVVSSLLYIICTTKQA